MNITLTPAKDIEKIYDESQVIELDYDKVKNTINNEVLTNAKSGYKTSTIIFKQFATNYKKIVWPTLLSETEHTFNPYTHASADSPYTYGHRSYNEVGYESHLGACDVQSPFATNILIPLAAAGYSWLFIFTQNEEYPCGFIVSYDRNYSFNDELNDSALAYNEVVDVNQVVFNNFTITTPDGQSSQEKDEFYKHIKDLFNIFNNIATDLSPTGVSRTSLTWQAFDTDMQNFLYKTDIDITKNPEPLRTLDWIKSPEESTADYTANHCVDFAIYRDKNREILATDSWETTLAEETPDEEGCYTILQMVCAVSDYYFRPMWGSRNNIIGIYLTWKPSDRYTIDNYYQQTVFDIINGGNLDYESSYTIDVPSKTDYESTKAEVNGQYLVSLLSQISSGLSTAMKNSEQTTTILWSGIDSLNSGVVRDFWNNNQAWSGVIFKKNSTYPNTGSTAQTMSDAVCQFLNASVFNHETAYDENWTADYLITPIYYRDNKGNGSANGFTNPADTSKSCGIIIGYRTFAAYNRMKEIYEDYINNKTSIKS